MSQFVLSNSLSAADEALSEQNRIALSSAEYEWFMTKLEEPPRDLPELRKLLSEPTVFDS